MGTAPSGKERSCLSQLDRHYNHMAICALLFSGAIDDITVDGGYAAAPQRRGFSPRVWRSPGERFWEARVHAAVMKFGGRMSKDLDRCVKAALDETRLLILGVQVLLGFEFQCFFQDGFSNLSESSKFICL
jgi:hypothetical protein